MFAFNKKAKLYHAAFLIFSIALLSLVSTLCLAQLSEEEFGMADRPTVDTFAWGKVEWSGDEKPLAQARAEADTALSKADSPAQLHKIYEAYKETAQQQPSDLVAQFSWADATFQLATRNALLVQPDRKGPRGNQALREVLAPAAESFEKVAPSPTYEYTRLRFLLEALYTPLPQLVPIGQRLLKHAPKDYEVMFSLLVISPVNTDEERNQALLYAQELVKANPKTAKYYTAKGWIHFLIYQRTSKEADKIQAVESYQKFLELASPTDPFRKDAKEWMEMIQQS